MARDDRDARGGHSRRGMKWRKGRTGELLCGCCPAHQHGTKEPLNRSRRKRMWRSQSRSED